MRNNQRCIWTSSYDRGLDHLLSIWPEVLKEVPTAELYITYGWQTFDAVHRDNPERHAWKEQMSKLMAQQGITHLGRVGQAQMVELLKESGIWSYPTDFEEISCISAMKAQVYGAIPVTMTKAALNETVQYGSKVGGDISDPEVKKTYLSELVAWLKDDQRQEATRKIMMPWAKKTYDWAGVAEEWTAEFKTPSRKETEFKEYVSEVVIPEMETVGKS